MEYPCHGSTEEHPPDQDARTGWALLLLRPAHVGRRPRSSPSGALWIERTAEVSAMHCRAPSPSFRGWGEYRCEHRCRLFVLQHLAASGEVPQVSGGSPRACAQAYGGRPMAADAGRQRKRQISKETIAVAPNNQEERSPISRAALLTSRPASVGDAVYPLLALDLLGSDVQTELLLQRPCERAPDGMRLPAGCRDDLRDGGALFSAEHRDQF